MTNILIYTLILVPWMAMMGCVAVCYIAMRKVKFIKALVDIQEEQLLYLNEKLEGLKNDKK